MNGKVSHCLRLMAETTLVVYPAQERGLSHAWSQHWDALTGKPAQEFTPPDRARSQAVFTVHRKLAMQHH
jgi:hypothetical protein